MDVQPYDHSHLETIDTDMLNDSQSNDSSSRSSLTHSSLTPPSLTPTSLTPPHLTPPGSHLTQITPETLVVPKSEPCDNNWPRNASPDSTEVSGTQTKSEIKDSGHYKFTAHTLPPCKVCGAQATGFHYGANTCEACKGFFHRSLTRKSDYVCLQNSKCSIKPGKRNSCSHCRYQKCLSIGMSKTGIKTGRYTYEKRTKDILEIKTLQRKESDVKVQELDSVKKTNIEGFIKEIMDAKDRLVQSMLKDAQNSSKQEQEPSEDAHQKFNPKYDEEKLNEGKTRLKCLSPDDNSTAAGKDNDDVVKKWISAIDSGVLRHIISFIKSIPGFKSFTMTDQIRLIKHSFFEIWIVGRHPAFSTTLKTFQSIHAFSFNLVETFGEDFAGDILNCAGKLQNLNLTEEETFLLMVFVILQSDRCELTEPEKCREIQDNVTESLLYIIRQKHPNSGLRFGKIISVITELRNVTEQYHKLTERLVTSEDIPPLFWELISLS